MKNLIEALTIFAKYSDTQCPTHCEHDVLMVVGVTEEAVSEEDQGRLVALGFHWSDSYDCWASYWFGSA